MPRVRCPECDSKTKVPDDYDRSSIRCDECGHRIPLENDAAPARKAPARRRPDDLATWLHLMPLGIVTFISIPLLLLGFLTSIGGALAMLLGLLSYLGAFIFGCVIVFRQGNYISFDYLEFLGPARWLVAIFFFGFYLMGYIALLYMAQVMSVVRKPKVIGPYLALQAWGLMLIVAGPIVVGIGFARPRGPEFADAARRGNDQPPPPEPKRLELPPPPPPKVELPPQPPPPPPRLTGDEALDKTLADLGDKNSKVRRAAAEQLEKSQPNAHRAVVAKKLGEEALVVPVYDRTNLLRAMRVWATPNEVPGLLQLLADDDINTRHEVLRVLGKVPDQRAIKPVVACFKHFPTQYHGGLTLKEMGPMVEKDLWPLLNDPEVRSPTVAILKEVGTPLSIPALQAASKEFTIQYGALEAIKTIQARSKK